MPSISDINVLDRVLGFNFRPMTWMHGSWVEALPLPIKQSIDQSQEPRLDPAIAKSINIALGLHQKYQFEFDTPLKKLSLLPSADLQRLVYLCGLGMQQLELRRVVEKEQVIQIRNSVSDDDYRFVMQGASRFTKGFDLGSLPPKPAKVNFVVQANVLGAQCLRAAFVDEPEALYQRICLKLPKAWGSTLSNVLFDFPADYSQTYIRKIAAHIELEKIAHNE